MCGRYSLTRPERAVLKRFDLFDIPELPARYNVAPTQLVPVVRRKRDATEDPAIADRELVLMRFGLVPSWAPDLTSGAKMINARSETVMDKPAFRESFQRRRCLVPADGFYEWEHQGKRRVPHWFRVKGEDVFAFAGIWDRWYDEKKNRLESFAILTTEPNALVEPLHDRMPLILHPEDWKLWLDPEVSSPDALEPLLVPFPAEAMIEHAVSERVNSPANDDPSCLEPDRGPAQGSLF